MYSSKQTAHRLLGVAKVLILLSLTALTTAPVAAQTAGSGAIFDVTDYGATGGDQTDDTAAIQAAIDAASEANGGTVFFPTGTYIVSPPGTAVVAFFVKENGIWVKKEGGIRTEQKIGNWHFQAGQPLNSTGQNGDLAVGLRDGKVYRKVNGSWTFDDFLVKKTGNGWTSGHDVPGDETGINGDVYLKFHLDVDNKNGAAFLLTPMHNHITFKGEGVGKSILSFQTWSGQDPMDYKVDIQTKTVLYSAIPADYKGRYKRGSMFVMDQQRIYKDMEDIHWVDLEMRGNTIASGKDNWYTAYHDLEEWDISNKGIVFSFGARDMYNLSVRNCSVHGWRGEILYKGGSNYAEILIENCDIYETNSSAVSISGNMIMRNCRVWNTYNGVENYCDTGQFSEIYNCEFDLGRKFGGKFGIVYLGTEDAHLIVKDCVIIGAKGGLFLSDFAHNVEVTNSDFIDCRWGVYAKYLNMYKLPGAFNNLHIENNRFIARTTNCAYAVLNATLGIPCKDWMIVGNEAIWDGGKMLKFLGSDHRGPVGQHNVILQDNVAPDTYLFDGLGIVPQMINNIAKGEKINTWTATTDTYNFSANSEEITVTYIEIDGLKMQLDNTERYPVGHKFTMFSDHANFDRSMEFVPAGWNNLDRGYVLVKGASISFEKMSDGVFHLTNYTLPTTDLVDATSSGTVISAYGLPSINLNPAEPTVYDSFSGFPVNVPVTVYVNENVRIAATAYIKTPTGQLFDPDESKPLTLVKNAEGVLTFSQTSDPSGGDETSSGKDTGGILTPLHLWTFDNLSNSVVAADLGDSPLELDVSEAEPGLGIAASPGLEFLPGHNGVRIPDSKTINEDVRRTLTISLWFRVESLASKKASVLYEQGGYWRGLNILLVDGQIQANGWNRPQEESDWSGTTLHGVEPAPGEWHHVALVLEAGTTVQADGLKLYFNGELLDSGPASQLWPQNDDNGIGQVQHTTVFLGRQVRALNPFMGSMDDISIWAEALSEAEINELIMQSFGQ